MAPHTDHSFPPFLFTMTISHRLKRATRTAGPVKKKALLIGIGYKGSNAQKELFRPHEDVSKLREFLIKAYGYTTQNITVMLDRPGELQPTQRNIRQQASRLVAGAAPGDHFLFYYAGHSVQVPELPTEEHTELDGLDEVIVPCDGRTGPDHQTTRQSCLVDNELKRLLINPLPAKASLVAILDTCHSASLLDLDHGKCNQKWTCPEDTAQHRKPVSLHDSSHPGPSRVSLPTPLKKTGPRAAVVRETEIMPERQHTPCARIQRREKIPGAFHGSICRCESPIADLCHMPRVISLSACREDQTTVENSRDIRGRSFTERLLNVLRKDPKPRLRDLMTKINMSIHGMILDATAVAQMNKPKACQDPQITSTVQLDMESHLETL
ncbi:caspase domain-containing protein [Mycena polygramma]|nr:caspase domain-containing protein [Mycena polygramma]